MIVYTFDYAMTDQEMIDFTSSEEKQMSKFKVGDRVKDIAWGLGEGNIIKVDSCSAYPYVVEYTTGVHGLFLEEELKLVKEESMKNNNPMIVTEVKVTTTEEKKIKNLINGPGPGGSLVSIYRNVDVISLVIGADYADKFRSSFTKKTLTELIEQLTEVRDLM